MQGFLTPDINHLTSEECNFLSVRIFKNLHYADDSKRLTTNNKQNFNKLYGDKITVQHILFRKKENEMGVHLKSLRIDGFKGIQNFELDHLNHINILTGDNNSGKTSVLELLSTIHSPQHLGSWTSTLRNNYFSYEGFYFDALYNLFPVDYELERPISYSYTDNNDRIHRIILLGEIEETQVTNEERNSIDRFIVARRDKTEEDSTILYDTQCLHLKIEGSDFSTKEYEIYDFQKRISHFVPRKPSDGIKTVYVSPTDHAKYFSLQEVLTHIELRDDLVRLLHEFDENIDSLVATDKGISYVKRGVEYLVLTNNHKKALPLSSYGDGMKKTLLIVSAMLQAKNGILLLDEFETAIHTSAMNHVFSWLIKCALNLNVQVFLTSHSKEAINKVLRCDETLKSSISYYTLYNYNNNNLVRYLTCEDAIIMQDKGGVDIR